MNILKMFYDPKTILNKHIAKGELPTSKEAFLTTYHMAWPSTLEAVLISLIGCFDMIMVGSLGTNAVNAVSICNQPKFICLAPIWALNTAVTVLVARRKGQNNSDDANRILKVGFILSFIVTLVMTSFGIYFARPLLTFAGASINYIDQAVEYFRIILFGQFFLCLGLTFTAAQRGAGNTKISMQTNLTANIINLIFNALLINGLFFFPKLEVRGAAIATAIGSISSFVLATKSIIKKDQFLKLSFKIKCKYLDVINSINNIWGSSLVEQIFLRIGFFIFAKAVAGLGDNEFAAHSVVMNIMTISFCFGDGLQVANTSLVGQALGAKREDLALIYTRISTTIGLCIAVILSAIFNTLGDKICYLFIQNNDVIDLCRIPMFILSITCFLQIPQVINVGALRGAGDVKFVAKMMLVSVAIIRPGLTYLLAYPIGLGLIGAWIGVFVDQFFRFLISLLRFNKSKWMEIEV